MSNKKTWEVAVFPSEVQWAEDIPDICLMSYIYLLCTFVFSAGLEICLLVASRHELGPKGILRINLKEINPKLSINKITSQEKKKWNMAYE